MKKIKAFLKNDIVERCYKTFFQTFMGTLLTVNIMNLASMDDVIKLILAAIVAGISAVWNILKTLIDRKLDIK